MFKSLTWIGLATVLFSYFQFFTHTDATPALESLLLFWDPLPWGAAPAILDKAGVSIT
jgi:hypothetical protein